MDKNCTNFCHPIISTLQATYQCSRFDRSRRIRAGLTILVLNCQGTFFLKIPNYHHVVCVNSMNQCEKYFKKSPWHEKIVFVLIDYHQTINQTYLLKFDQIKRILIVRLSQDQPEKSMEISDSNENTESKSKIIDVFDDCQSANAHLQETIVAIEQEDDGLFSTFNKNERSLIDVREELGSFVWNHSYRS